jgi:hypothetical protein
MFTTWVAIPAELPDISNLVKYASTPNLERYFCPNCGASVVNLDVDVEDAEWQFATGVSSYKLRVDSRASEVRLAWPVLH